MGDACTQTEGLVLTEPGVTVEIAGVSVCADTVVAALRDGHLCLDGLPARELTIVLQLVEIARRRTDAVVTAVVDRADRSDAYAVDGHKAVRGWVKASARWSNAQARTQRDITLLVRAHQRCADEYAAGRIGLAQMALLAKLANHPRAGVHFADSEELLVEDAQALEYEDFRQVCDHWLNLADMDGADRDEALRHYLRNGACIRARDGMTHLEGQFASVQGRFIKEVFQRFYDTETQADGTLPAPNTARSPPRRTWHGPTSNGAPTPCTPSSPGQPPPTPTPNHPNRWSGCSSISTPPNTC
jgi:hypothetical protein